MRKIAKFIVEKRIFIFVLFAGLVIYSILSIGKVRINEDITALLPADTVTRRGIVIMEEEFSTLASANVMVSNITPDRAFELQKKIEGINGVASVEFDDTKEHYASSAALFTITFSGTAEDDTVSLTLDQIREELKQYDISIYSDILRDYVAKLQKEMGLILLLAVIVIIAVMIFTSKSYFEVVIMFIVFIVAAVLNMGTNYWFGEISSITHTIAVILQLALAIDYAIIFCHRFQDEYASRGEVKPALIDSLASSIIEISASSLTTIAGLFAMTLMQFRLGFDLGIVLIKGIVCSLLTVFLLMPGLIMVFYKPLLKTRHKSLVPSIRRWGNFLANGKPILLIIFAVLIPVSIILSSKTDYSFSDQGTDRIVYSEQDRINERIHNTFESTSNIAILVPVGDYKKEKVLLQKVSALPEVKTALGLSNIEIEDGRMLTDPYTARDFSELIGVDVETAKLLYALYGYEHEQYQPILGERESYSVPLLDMMEFLLERIDDGIVTLDADQKATLDEMRGMLEDALKQLRGKNYVRMVVTSTLPVEGKESYELVDKIDTAAKELYGDDVLVIGDITSARDLENSYASDNWLVSILTIVFVFLVLLFTFRSFGASILLIFVIQGSIWINFSFPYIMGNNIFFITYLIVSAIQMGATIDYAIVLYNRFSNAQETLPPKEAMAKAVDESFPTILTSGIIMTAAGFIIAGFTTDLYVGSIGLAVGRGALTSVILVFTALPQILLLGNKFMKKTTFDLKKLIRGGSHEKES